MKKSKIIIVLLLFFFIVNSYNQDVSFYMHIDNPDYIPAETKIKSGSTDEIEVRTKRSDFNKVLKRHKIKHFKQAFPTADTKWLREIYYVKSSDSTLSNEIKKIFKDKISSVETLCEPTLCYTPNDYGLARSQTNLDLVKAKDAWDFLGELPRISIGVSDTHFETTHEDLNGQFITVLGSNTSNGSEAWHGTAVAGILSAVTNNNIGISALSYNAKMYATSNWGNDNEVLLLAQKGYRVINCSWFNSCSYNKVQDSLYSLIKNKYNTIVVFGAGNKINHCGSLAAKVYPASLNSVISVTSVGHINPRGYVDPIYGKADWKDCHEETIGNPNSAHHHNDAVDICAPGYNVTSTYDASLNNGKYGGVWGTSFAAPTVASAISLILSINPCLSADEAMNIIVNSADESIYNIPENSAYIGLLGKGRLDVTAAASWAVNTATVTFSAPTTLDGTITIQSNYAIRTTASFFKISSGSNVSFIARKEIELGPGFEVENNASFSAICNPNNPVICK